MEPELKNIKTIIKTNLPINPNSESKMIRSKLGILVLKGLNLKITNPVLNFLAAIELIHNASLFHDDVIDNEILRRGTKSLNATLGEKTAVLYGNITLSNATKLLLQLDSTTLIEKMNNCIKKMCEGELIQIAQKGNIPTINEYLRKSKLKTASLFEFLMEGLSLLSKTPYTTELKNFGENFGIAFQINNDLSDYLKGVKKSSDIKNKIYTAPIIYANSIKDDKLAIDKTTSLIDNYCTRAEDILSLLGDSSYKTTLIGVIKCLKI